MNDNKPCLWTFEYNAYGWHEVYAIVELSEDAARAAVDAQASKIDDTVWPEEAQLFKVKCVPLGDIYHYFGD